MRTENDRAKARCHPRKSNLTDVSEAARRPSSAGKARIPPEPKACAKTAPALMPSGATLDAGHPVPTSNLALGLTEFPGTIEVRSSSKSMQVWTETGQDGRLRPR